MKLIENFGTRINFFEKIKNKVYEDAKNISGEKYNMPNSCVITILNKFDIFSERNAVKPLLLAKYPRPFFPFHKQIVD